MTNHRPELRRQWREDNLKRKREGLPVLPWQEWGISFVPLEKHDPQLAASRDALRRADVSPNLKGKSS